MKDQDPYTTLQAHEILKPVFCSIVPQIQEVARLVKTGMTKAKVAKELKIGEATVYRILKNTNTDSVINEGSRPLHDSSGT